MLQVAPSDQKLHPNKYICANILIHIYLSEEGSNPHINY